MANTTRYYGNTTNPQPILWVFKLFFIGKTMHNQLFWSTIFYFNGKLKLSFLYSLQLAVFLLRPLFYCLVLCYLPTYLFLTVLINIIYNLFKNWPTSAPRWYWQRSGHFFVLQKKTLCQTLGLSNIFLGKFQLWTYFIITRQSLHTYRVMIVIALQISKQSYYKTEMGRCSWTR